ncbi:MULTISPECIES: hypothetical protein [Streptomyces]|uniref:hypothetical protein n=1 Tax=Streptomyces TaxID=1883 RepID=UPI0025B55B45|nr:hypothetical protein [Streptomyces sp. P9-2B-1]WJY32279.1 hypothetical protein QTO28_15255 [Streptomyces sp. P9-2B-1]
MGAVQHPDVNAPSAPPWPVVGDLAYDTVRNRYGVVMERTPGQVYLRPKDGGREWAARPEHIELARAGEALSPQVAEANARSRGEIL